MAFSLMITLAGGLVALLAHSRRAVQRADSSTIALAAAAARLERLRSVPWPYDVAGAAVHVPLLDESPADSLRTDTAGYAELLDRDGQPLPAGATGARLVSRWAVSAAGADAEVRALESCVFEWPAAPGAPALACLVSWRARQP
ncbi:MAG: hypothetical protein R2712_00765 [Vicinamibacterales bacterium]